MLILLGNEHLDIVLIHFDSFTIDFYWITILP
jgi:hypothetical protein